MLSEKLKKICEQFLDEKYKEYYSTISKMQQEAEYDNGYSSKDIKREAIKYAKEDAEDILNDLVEKLLK